MNEAKQMNEVRACFGLLIYNLQLVEQQFINMIVAEDLHDIYGIKPTNLDSAFGSCFNQTIESMLPDLKKIYYISDEDSLTIKHALELRTVFSFRYFGKRSKELFSTEGRTAMIAELEKASLDFTQTGTILREAFNHYLKEHLLFKDQIDQKVNTLFKKHNN